MYLINLFHKRLSPNLFQRITLSYYFLKTKFQSIIAESAPVTVNQQVQGITTARLRLILLTQDDHPLEAHTADFLELASQTHYSDHDLSPFFHAGLNEQLRNKISVHA